MAVDLEESGGKLLLNGEAIATENQAWTGGIGYGQTWQDVTASRALATDYTNSTGKPIQISCTVRIGTDAWGQIMIDGVKVASSRQNGISGYYDCLLSAIVPDGGIYSLTGTSLQFWSELR